MRYQVQVDQRTNRVKQFVFKADTFEEERCLGALTLAMQAEQMVMVVTHISEEGGERVAFGMVWGVAPPPIDPGEYLQ